MHIGYFSPGWPASAFANGIISSVEQMTRALDGMGHRGHVLTHKLVGVAESATIHAVEPRRKLRSSFANQIARRTGGSSEVMSPLMEGVRSVACRLHDRGELDLLEIEESWGWARHLVGRIPVPVVVRLHGPWFLNGRANGIDIESGDPTTTQRIRDELSGILAADGISGPSDCVIRETERYYDVQLADAASIPNSMDVVSEHDRWSSPSSDRSSLLFVGRFDRHKGGDIVLRSFASVWKRHPEAKLYFCGPDRGLRDDSGTRWTFQEYVDKLDLPQAARGQIVFLGQQTPAQIARLRRQAAVTVAASRFETFGNTVLEAAAHGCPVIAARCGGSEEILVHEQTGLLVPSEDPDAMSDAIVRLLNDRTLATRLGEHAWNDARERFDPVKIAERSVAFYDRTIARTGSSRLKV